MPLKIGVIIYGPPGAGKGTQAELLAKKKQLIHFDTGRYLESILHSKEAEKNKILKKEQQIWDSGVLNTPSWVLEIVKKFTGNFARAGAGIVLSGSPRTIFETFGDKKTEGLISFLTKIYGKKKIFIINLKINNATSINRNSKRLVCSVCNLSILAESKINKCSLCGGPAKKRILDNPETIKIRLKEYEERTLPIISRLKKNGYNVVEVNGDAAPFKVSELILNKIEENLDD